MDVQVEEDEVIKLEGCDTGANVATRIGQEIP
jgi:hypothetical protein